MKIAMTTTLLPVTHYSVSLLQALQRVEGLDVLVYANRDESNRSVPVENLELTWENNSLYPLQILLAVLRDNPDLVHLQHEINMYGGKIGAVWFPLLLLLLRLMGKKIVVTVHAVVDSRQVDADFAATFSWSASHLSLATTKLVLAYVYRSIAWLSSAIIVHTKGLGSMLVTLYGTDPEKVFVIPIGVSPPIADCSQVEPSRFDLEQGEAFILCFGYVVRRKGLEHLLESFKALHPKFPHCKLILAGGARDPGYLSELQDWVEENGLASYVVFPGLVDETEISWLFSHARFAVFAYQYSVSASHPLTFAIGHSCPVIVPAMGTFEEDISAGVDGLLAPPRDPHALMQAMSRLLDDDRLRDEMKANMDIKRRDRSWPRVAVMTQDVYLRILQ